MSSNEINKIYADMGAERVIIGLLLQYGVDALVEIESVIEKDDFYSLENQALFSAAKNVIEENNLKNVTVDAVLSEIKKQNTKILLNKPNECLDFLKICKQQLVKLDEVKIFTKPIKFWSITRSLKKRLDFTLKDLNNLTGEEKLLDVISKTEEAVFDFLPSLLKNDEIQDVGDFITPYLEHLSTNPVSTVGLPTGFDKYDSVIGGGLRKGTINIIGARTGVGKSFICLNIAKHILELNIPVLYLDTELNIESQSNRLIALLSQVEINKIETGLFGKDPHLKNQVLTQAEKCSHFPLAHVSVAGKSIDEILSLCRKWLHNKVGKDQNGKIKNCLIIMDYIKTMDLNDLGKQHQEYQYLGDMVTKMHNFAVKYDVPFLATVQLNRDGITKDSTDVISGSDRIAWLCSSLSILKDKTPEDLVSNPRSEGDKKLVILKARHGRGMNYISEYINIKTELARSSMIEGNFNYDQRDAGQLFSATEDSETITI